MSRLSLEDIDRWSAEDIRTVFGQAIQRANDSRAVGVQVGTLTTFLEWDGDTADAANGSAERILLDLNAHADACEAVGEAAESAAAKVETVKQQVANIRAELDANSSMGITIDNALNKVNLPVDINRRRNEAAIRALAADLQRMVDAAITAAELADDDLAAAIRAADGSLSPEQVQNQLDDAPVSVPWPPSTDDPYELNKWWDSMSPEQQATAAERFGPLLGNIDGVPPEIRSEINVDRLPGEIAAQRAIIDAAPPLTAAHPRHSQAVLDAKAKLADLLAIQDTLAQHPEVGLLLLDSQSEGDRVLAATFVGDIDNAENVSVTTPGMTTRPSESIGGMTREAIALRDQSLQLSGGEDVATIAWIGYETPGLDFGVTNDTLAKEGAVDLNHFYHGLAATSNVGDQHLTALGHSYGSLTTSLALQQGAPVDDVVLYGSPGGEISNVTDLGVQPGHGYYMVAQDDTVAIEIADWGPFGGQIQDVDGMTPLSTAAAQSWDADNGQWVQHESATGHSEYPRDGSNGELRTPGYNMAAIVAGNPDAVIGPPPERQMLPYGPRGANMPNPDYHS